jgi:outer membrane protein assembly factor BamB
MGNVTAFGRGLRRAVRSPAPVAAVVLALGASGCWPQPGAGPGHTRNNGVESGLHSGNVAGLEEIWSVPTAAWAYEPVVDGGRVVVSEDRRPNSGALHVEAFSPDTGERLWDRVLVDGGERPVVSPVAFSGDALVTGYGISGGTWPPPATCPTGIERLDAATGDRLAFEPGWLPLGPAVTSGDSVAVVTQPIGADCARRGSQRFEVRDRETLALNFSYTSPTGSLGTWPTFAGDLVVIADDHQLLAFPASGCGAATCSPVWTASLPNSPPLQTSSFGLVMAADGLLFAKTGSVTAGGPVPTFTSGIRVYDPATGAALGVTDLGSGTSWLAVRDSTIYYTQVPSGATNVVYVRAVKYCRDCAARFTPLWSAPIEGTHFTTGVTIGGDVVYVGASSAGDGVVVALDADGCGAETCSPLATVPVTGSATDLSVSVGRVFAATTLGNGNHALSALALP